MARVEIRLMGRFEVHCNGRQVAPSAFGGRLAGRLVRLLATRRGSVVPRAVLIEALWPHRQPKDPDANLNVQVNRARRALGDGLIETVPGGYLLTGDVDACRVDTERFLADAEAGFGALHREEPGIALDWFSAALRRWRGEPLPEDVHEDWAVTVGDRLRGVHQRVLEGAAEAALQVGDAPSASDLADQAVSQQPLREPGHLLRARALAVVGDQAGALDALAELRRRLRDEMGIDPSDQAEELQRRILQGDVHESAPTRSARIPQPVVHGHALRFVGRDEDVAAVVAAVAGPRAGVTVVSGRSGAGKSRLLAEARRRCGCPSVTARAFPSEADEPWGVARTLLAEVLSLDVAAFEAIPARAAPVIADLVPRVDVEDENTDLDLDPRARRSLLLEAGIRLLAAATGDGLLVVVDDLQWADATSLHLLARTVERVDRLGVAVAYRPEELAPDGDVAVFLDELARGVQVTTVHLDELAPEALAALVPDEALAAVLSRATDRTPFAVAEVIGALAADHLVAADRRGAWRARRTEDMERIVAVARDGQRQVTDDRIARRPRRQSDVLALLALRGRETTTTILAGAADRSVEAVAGDLDAMTRAELVHHGEAGWAPSHDRIAAAATDRLTTSRRVDLHRRLAAALRAAGSDSAEVGRHLAAAGEPGAGSAYAAAARQRIDAYATAEARDLAVAGLAADPDGPSEIQLLEVRAEASHRQGRLADARHDLRSALRAATAGVVRARLQSRLAMLELGAEDLTRAAELIEVAVVEAGSDPRARAEALAVAAIVDMNQGNGARSRNRSAEAMGLYRSLGDARGVAGILDGQAMADFLDGDVAGAIDAFDRVARLFVDSGDPLRAITPRSTRGHARVFAGDPTGGLEDTSAALDLARELGDREGEAYALWHRSEAMTGAGHLDAGLETAAEALSIAERIGHRGWTATGHRATGVALQAAGELAGAEAAFRRSLDHSEHLSLFGCWAAARLALVLVAVDRLDEAAEFVARALDEGPPLGRFEARLAHAELVTARGDADASDIAAAALADARRWGHLTGTDRLDELSRQAG